MEGVGLMLLTEGEKAPNFTLRATGGRTISLSDFRGRRHVVLFFYHQDGHPVCTTEVESFRDLHPSFEEAGAAVLGISSDHVLEHESFARGTRLKYYLLSDEDRIVWNTYSTCRGEKHLLGEDRLTFVIDKEGICRKIWREVTVDGHAEDVLVFVTGLQCAP
jgi:peroxiredoxin Q/BCP